LSFFYFLCKVKCHSKIDDTSNFDEFPNEELEIAPATSADNDVKNRDFVFVNYTYRRFYNLTQKLK
jgi:serine/threonine kinase 38